MRKQKRVLELAIASKKRKFHNEITVKKKTLDQMKKEVTFKNEQIEICEAR